jgi:hypothetical protein
MANAAVTDIERPKYRPFSLADAMILIIALALGLAIARPAIILIADAVRSDPRWRFRTIAGAVSLGRMLNIVLFNFLFFLLPAVLIVRLKRPRAPLRSLIHQPGFAACAAPIGFFLVALPLFLLNASGLRQHAIEIAGQILLPAAGPLAWVCLIATRRWAAEPSWIDRLGRIVGALWMVSIPAHLVLIRLPY